MARRQSRSTLRTEGRSTPVASYASGRFAVRPGTFNLEGHFFTPDGDRLELHSSDIAPTEAAKLVRSGARVAFEQCGCGGGDGCTPQWPETQDAKTAAASGIPKFTDRYGSPTWIDVWHSNTEQVVFLHGDVEWGTLLH